jgi:hypothetical protein
VEVTYIMRALEPEVFDAVWAAVEALLPMLLTSIRSAVIVDGFRIGSVSTAS